MIPPEVPPENFNTRHISLPSEPDSADLSRTGPLDLQRPWVVEFRVVGTASTIKARVTDSMMLGRNDSTSGFTPEVDLTPYDALAKGVSRKHALITVKEQRLMLRDLNSTNGTRLNNVLCAPGEEYRLRHGNELTLGTLRLQVSFAVVPAFTDTQHGSEIKDAVAPLIHSIGKKILVVESDPDVGSVIRAALEGVGYKVTLVADVIKGFGVVFQGMPDVLVLDLMEPDTNGLDLIRFVRKQKSDQHIPILAVSGALAGFQMNQALSAGADTFLGKPVSVEMLLDAVANACNPPPPGPPQLMGLGTAPLGKPEAPPTPAVEAPPPAAPAEDVAKAGAVSSKPEAAPVTPQAPARPVIAAVSPQAPAKPVIAPAQDVAKAVPASPKPEAAPVPPQVPARPSDQAVKVDVDAAPAAKEDAKPEATPAKPETSGPSTVSLPHIKPLPPRS